MKVLYSRAGMASMMMEPSGLRQIGPMAGRMAYCTIESCIKSGAI